MCDPTTEYGEIAVYHAEVIISSVNKFETRRVVTQEWQSKKPNQH
jgi:hypothetical protein